MRTILLCWLLIVVAKTFSQPRPFENLPIHFKNAKGLSYSLQDIKLSDSIFGGSANKGRALVFLQFEKIPDQEKLKALRASGIELLQYIPENTYLATVTKSQSRVTLRQRGINATILMDKSYKTDQANLNAQPKIQSAGNILQKYHVQLIPGQDLNNIRGLIGKILKGHPESGKDIQVLSNEMLEISMTAQALNTLLDEPYILYAFPAAELHPLNDEATDIHQADILQSGFNGIPSLTGKNVTIGIGDAGRIYHIDLGYNEEGQPTSGNYHSTHVAGTLAGKGIYLPALKGYAYNSTLISESFNKIIYLAPEYYQAKHMVLTNNSYGAGSYCLPYSGQYSGYAAQGDQQMLDMPNLMHVFAAGNSGYLKCGDFPEGYKTIDNAYQAGKNVLTVGTTNHTADKFEWSKGPVMDGRIKPEISAIGTEMYSTITNNNYGHSDGSSMAAPQVTGTLALMVERYRQLNGNADPSGDLLKAAICNSATDVGTKGVDFANGFGWLNARKAVEIINNKTYKEGSVENDGEQSFEINLDHEVSDFKIMLYWHDKPSSFYSLKNLVNDLDLTVQGPDGSVIDPFILDTSAAGVLKPAVRGKDHINNIEQVVIDKALAGRYLVKVRGFKIPFGPQKFKIVYSWQEPGLRLLQPAGGELYKPSELRGIIWEDGDRKSDQYKFEFSTDGGQHWVLIDGTTGIYNRKQWTVPDTISLNAKIRLTNTVTNAVVISSSFVIMPELAFTATTTCASEILLKWNKPAGIDSIAVLQYVDGDYKEIAITTGTEFKVTELRSGPLYWFSLRPIKDGIQGERSNALKGIVTPAAVCPASGLSGDISINAILSPITTREGTSLAPVTTVPLKIEIENKGVTVISDSLYLDVFRDGLLFGKDTLVTNLSPGQRFYWTTKISFISLPGSVTKITTRIRKQSDPDITNNTTDTTWRQLANPPLTLPFKQDFSSIKDTIYRKPGFTGIITAESWDFETASTGLSLHSSAADGFTAITKYADQKFQLKATYNLSAYQVTDDIRLSLDIPEQTGNLVECYIRGKDTDPWLSLPFYDLVTYQPTKRHLNISYVLSEAGQTFSSSFQIKLDVRKLDFQTELKLLKSIELYVPKTDLTLVYILYNKQYVTDGDSVKFMLPVNNNRSVPSPTYSINLKSPDGQIQYLSMPSLEAGGQAYAIFTASVNNWPNPSATVYGWIDAVDDDNRSDDSSYVILNYAPKISTYPYLEGFEKGEAGWGSTKIYEHSSKLSESIEPFHAANGNAFWGTDWVHPQAGLAAIEPSGYLVSPLFDISQLSSPWLSMSVNKQLCDEKDSVYIELSSDTGRTWTRFLPIFATTNWYSEATGNCWKGCGENFWQVVSAPLPQNMSTIQFRIVSIGRNDGSTEFPRLPGGLLLDDVHVFDKQYGVIENRDFSAISGRAKSDLWNPVSINGQIAAGIKPAKADKDYQLRGSSQSFSESFLANNIMPRSWIFTGASSGKDSSRLRLYFTHEEWKEWISSINLPANGTPSSPYDLAVFRYNGSDQTINEKMSDNIPGFETFWDPESFDLVPYDKGYYAEVPSDAYGEFYLGINSNLFNLEFNAVAGPKFSAQLNWIITPGNSISRFEIQRAPSLSGREGVFQTIGTVGGVVGTSHYNYTDPGLSAPSEYLYRIKLVWTDGQVRYSGIRRVNFVEGLKLEAYPNPGSLNQVWLIVRGEVGKNLELILYDALGRYIWNRKITAGTEPERLPISVIKKRLPAGVYHVKLASGKENKVIRLVITNK